ncbi:MAG: cell division protein FtsW [Lachnospiraceae bacterium]|jgi:cell division protein FtsW|nr:cell division protein FtsW [Lachnospiraceae bacterium]
MAGKKRERLFHFSLRGLDTNLLVVLFFLMIFGFIMLYSTSYYTAGLSKAYNYDSMYLLKTQITYSLLGIAAMLVVSCINYHVWSLLVLPGYVFCCALVLLLKVPSLGVTVKGATRWLRIGPIQFQVAEPIKLIMIIFMATLIVVRRKKLRSWMSMIRMIIPTAIVSALILVISNNMSTAAILLGTAVFMIYVVHPEQWKFFLCAAGTAALVAGVLYYVKNLDPAEMNEINFRLVRIRAWLFPYEYEQGKAYQSLQGLYAIGSGGLWGKGLGNSIQKLGKIPEPYNDYIFAIICEELGIFGAGLIILLFIYLLYRLYTISQTAHDLLGRMLAIGVLSHIALQVILNLMVVTNLFPTTGVTLPFFSSGGTASVFLLIEIGVVLNVNKYSVEKRLEALRERGLRY